MAVLVFFRRETSEALNLYGGGLGTFGRGIQGFISSVASPQISPAFTPTIGLGVTGLFKDAQNYFFGNENKNTQRVDATPSGSSGGFNTSQSTAESGGDRKVSSLLTSSPGTAAYFRSLGR